MIGKYVLFKHSLTNGEESAEYKCNICGHITYRSCIYDRFRGSPKEVLCECYQCLKLVVLEEAIYFVDYASNEVFLK